MRKQLKEFALATLNDTSSKNKQYFTGDHPLDFYILGMYAHKFACEFSGRTNGMGGNEVLPAFCEQRAADFLHSLPNKYWVAKLLFDTLYHIEPEKENEKISWNELRKAIEMNRATAVGRIDLNADFEKRSVSELGDALAIGAFVLNIDRHNQRARVLSNPVFFAHLD